MKINEPASFRNTSPVLGAPSLAVPVNFNDTARFIATSSGLGDFVVLAAVAGYKTPEQAAIVAGKTYHYFAQFNDQWEEGYGTYNWSTDTLSRTSIYQNSLSTEAKINFSARPIVDIFEAVNPYVDHRPASIPAGAKTVFFNATAPVGWTLDTSHHDKVMRVLATAGGGSGGNITFSTFWSRTSTDNYTLSVTDIPNHGHPYSDHSPVPAASGNDASQANYILSVVARNTSGTGGGGAHAHGVDNRLQYMDMILCTKDVWP